MTTMSTEGARRKGPGARGAAGGTSRRRGFAGIWLERIRARVSYLNARSSARNRRTLGTSQPGGTAPSWPGDEAEAGLAMARWSGRIGETSRARMSADLKRFDHWLATRPRPTASGPLQDARLLRKLWVCREIAAYASARGRVKRLGEARGDVKPADVAEIWLLAFDERVPKDTLKKRMRRARDSFEAFDRLPPP